jgi:disulfide bond formation protein DsbB
MTMRQIHIATLCLAVATITTALASQYIGGLEPCDLCYKQRWPYYFAIPCLALALRPHFARPLIALALFSFAIGAAVAAYHAGVEYGWWQGPTGCTGHGMMMGFESLEQALQEPVIRCDQPAFTLFGVSMAGYNFFVSVILTAMTAGLLRSIVRAKAD